MTSLYRVFVRLEYYPPCTVVVMADNPQEAKELAVRGFVHDFNQCTHKAIRIENVTVVGDAHRIEWPWFVPLMPWSKMGS